MKIQLPRKFSVPGLPELNGITAKSREDVESSVGFLSLHEQVRMNDTNVELNKLNQLKTDVGELSSQDEKK